MIKTSPVLILRVSLGLAILLGMANASVAAGLGQGIRLGGELFQTL